MILIWQGTKLGEISSPTIKEMRVIKRDLGIRNPITFLNRAVMMQVEKPVIGPDGQPQRDPDGKIVTEAVENDDYDMDCLAMLIAIMKTRNGVPTDFDEVDGDITDLQIELSETEKEQLAKEQAEGKDPAPGTESETPPPSSIDTTSATTSTNESGSTPLPFGSSTA